LVKSNHSLTAPVSLLKYSPAFILLAIAAADASRVADTDLWGHLLFGQWILTHRQLLRHDPYSYSAPGTVWIDHEWLSEVVMTLSYRIAGVIGLKLLKCAGLAAIILFSAIAIGETGASPVSQQVIVIIEACALRLQVQCRPELSTLVLLSWLLMLLARDTYRGRTRLWLAVPVFALWCNLHGGYVVGLAVLGLYLGITALDDWIAGRDKRRLIESAAILTAATLVTLINPYGPRLWMKVWNTVSNPLIRQMIDEWHPLIPALAQSSINPAVLVVCLPTLLLMASLVICELLTPNGRDLALVAIAVLLSVSAFYAVRNLQLATTAVCLPLAFHVGLVRTTGFGNSWGDLLEKVKRLWHGSPVPGAPSLEVSSAVRPGQTSTADGAIYQRSGTNPLLVATAAIALAACTGLFSSELKAAPGTSYPVGAIAFLKKHGLHGNLLCDYNWAGYVMWHTSPTSKVFIDGRCETVYPANVIRDYIRFHFGLSGSTRVLTQYRHDYVLVPTSSQAYKVTIEDPNWKLLYRDSQSAVFGHRGLTSAGRPSERFAGSVAQFRFP
jgi:hypothetical protein